MSNPALPFIYVSCSILSLGNIDDNFFSIYIRRALNKEFFPFLLIYFLILFAQKIIQVLS